jgi:hypothetical protein
MWIGIEGFVNSCSEARRTGLVEARCPLVDSLERARVVCEEPYVAYGMVWFKCRHPVPEHFSTLHKGFHLGIIHLCSRAEADWCWKSVTPFRYATTPQPVRRVPQEIWSDPSVYTRTSHSSGLMRCTRFLWLEAQLSFSDFPGFVGGTSTTRRSSTWCQGGSAGRLE